MKHVTILLTTLYLLCTASTFSQINHKANHKKFKSFYPKGIKTIYDEYKNITWVSSKFYEFKENIGNGMKLYYGVKYDMNTGEYEIMPLRVKFELRLNDWIFWNKINVLYGDNNDKRNGTTKRYEFTFDENLKKTNTYSGGFVQEDLDIELTTELEQFLRETTSEIKPIGFRFTGKKYVEYNRRILLKKYEPIKEFLDSYFTILTEYSK